MIIRSMGYSKVRWTLLTSVLVVCLAAGTKAVVTSGASDKVSIDGPPGLIDIQNAEDLVAEASVDTQKREIPVGGLSNSYGEPIPADSYGPPSEDNIHVLAPQPIPISDSYGPPIKSDLGLPIPIYGVPDDPSNHVKYPEPPPDIPPPIQLGGPPHQTYGPPPLLHDTYGPPKINIGHGHGHGGIHKLPQYHGPPPPPSYGPPKLQYGPPKQLYGPPKAQYGPPPKLQYGPPKPLYGPPKQQYGPPKIQFGPPKPQYGPPKQHFGPPKIQYGPPKPQYGPPKIQYGPPKPQFGLQKPLFFQKPHPIYGPPISTAETNQVLKPLFPIPEDTYGPPGKPIIAGDQFSQQLLVPDQAYGPPIGIHHGPPQPDPNPRPAHPGIPAPPTPPHILYDGWTPIPGLVSKPPQGHGHIGINLQDNYGPPPPPPPPVLDISSFHSSGGIDSSLGIGSIGSGVSIGSFGAPSVSYGAPVQSVDIHSIGGGSDHSHSSNSFISGGYSSVSGNEGLQGIDLNSIIGSSHSDGGIGLQGSKTVFEAHYTEGGGGHGSLDSGSHISSIDSGSHSHGSSGASVSVLQSLGFDLGSSSIGSNSHSHAGSISTSYGVPADSFSPDGPYPGPRQLGSAHSFSSDIGLKPPSGVYGVPPGGKYGVPPPPPPHNIYKPAQSFQQQLALSYGVPSGSTGSGSLNALSISPPKRPINFREPVPQGLIENIGHVVVQKDSLGIDHSSGHAQHEYLPPPVQALPQKGHSTFSNEISHNSGSSFSIQASIEPSNLYSLPSVANPINFHGHGGQQQISSTGYSSSLDSYNAPLATIGDSYGAPSIESSIITTLDGKTISKTESSESRVVKSDTASLAAAILKNCPYHKALYEAAKNVEQNNPSVLASSLIASLNSESSDSSDSASSVSTFKQLPPGPNIINFNENAKAQSSSEENNEESQKGKSLNTGEQSASSQSGFQQFQSLSLNSDQFDQSQINHQQILSQNFDVLNGIHNIPIQGNRGSYTLQIQSANGLGQTATSSDVIPHEQVLSEGLLQSILQAIEQPHQTQIIPQETPQLVQIPQNEYFDLNHAQSGLVLPEGYEVQPKNIFNDKDTKKNNIKRGDQIPDDEDSSQEGSDSSPVIIVAPQNAHVNSKSFLEQFGINSKKSEEKAPEIVTPLSIIDDNEIAVYFNSNNNKDDYNFDYDRGSSKDNEDENRNVDEEDNPDDESTETVTEISIETSISASDNEFQKNAQQYGDESKFEKKGKFGDKIVKKTESKSEERL